MQHVLIQIFLASPFSHILSAFLPNLTSCTLALAMLCVLQSPRYICCSRRSASPFSISYLHNADLSLLSPSPPSHPPFHFLLSQKYSESSLQAMSQVSAVGKRTNLAELPRPALFFFLSLSLSLSLFMLSTKHISDKNILLDVSIVVLLCPHI